MDLVQRVGALLLSIEHRIDTRNRERIWGSIVLCWIGIMVVSIVAGIFITSAVFRTLVTEFIASLLVAAIIFITADVIFGFSRRQEERIEATAKATYMLLAEIEMNRKELARIVEALEEGRYPAPNPKLESENWHLFVQGPSAHLIPSDLFWVLQEAYWVPRKVLENFESRRSHTSPSDAPKIAGALLPDFRLALKLVDEALEALKAAYIQE